VWLHNPTLSFYGARKKQCEKKNRNVGGHITGFFFPPCAPAHMAPSFQKFLSKKKHKFFTTTNRTDISATVCLFFPKLKVNAYKSVNFHKRRNIRNNATEGNQISWNSYMECRQNGHDVEIVLLMQVRTISKGVIFNKFTGSYCAVLNQIRYLFEQIS
jgi:hypothetical protein